MKNNISNLFNRINDKGFMISTLIYGIFIAFILILSALMVTLNYRKNAFSNITISESDVTPDTEETGEGDGDDSLYVEKELNGCDPILGGLVPVKYVTDSNVVSGHWETASLENRWYKYTEQEWANGVILDLSTDDQKDKFLEDDGSYKTGVTVQVPDGTAGSNSDVIAMFVWIPRYSYAINCDKKGDGDVCLGTGGNSNSYPGAIDIKFGKDLYYNTTSYYNGSFGEEYLFNHPAFNFGGEQITGMWVGKFETTGSSSSPTIEPNVLSLKNLSVKSQFETSKKFVSDYGLSGDSHMMKNSEWGAVAYLSQSKYGKYGNSSYSNSSSSLYKKEVFFNDSNSYTGRSLGLGYPQDNDYCTEFGVDGCFLYNGKLGIVGSGWNDYYGPGASTTGNIYGVYDMNGGSSDRVMAFYKNYVSLEAAGLSGIEEKYYDAYDGEPNSVNFNSIGHGTYEVARKYYNLGWYNDYLDVIYGDDGWVTRGGYVRKNPGGLGNQLGNGPGIFATYFGGTEGFEHITFRVSFIPKK